ncbi:MAG: hypothetical protein CL912_02705 [Deltaproteobacteria bacterium]|nr:hypothetical protein [Deltaproteobacteria bacterium]
MKLVDIRSQSFPIRVPSLDHNSPRVSVRHSLPILISGNRDLSEGAKQNTPKNIPGFATTTLFRKAGEDLKGYNLNGD